METRNRIWVGLGVVVAASTAFYVGTTGQPGMVGMDHSMMTSAEGGEGGEGATTADAIANDAVYLAQLAFIRGHLNVGVDLYRQGEEEASATHMKHPGDELYTDLLPAIEVREASGFADQLEALATAVENKRPLPTVESAYSQLLEAITAAENAVENQDAAMIGAVIFDLVSTSAAEYDIAVGDNGALENEHEYQDALGFVRIARELLARLEGMTDNTAAVASIREQLDLIMPIWPSLRAPQTLETDPSVLYGAAARIEFATAGL
ncbi:MAG: hypothetical protein Q8L60_12585 [Gammaproteobacteria bacterium]|nr:hypothetical protein [Gammaproteobacteria bacterium]MDP2140458.1 hypothetical protein [Gammaproteobacteria bacterium]MDP2349497.1 hypothetical protein [Gammaproteobacteria bacterium]